MTELLSGIKSILIPWLESAQLFLTSFIREDLQIFGLAYYKWVLILFVGSALAIMLLSLID